MAASALKFALFVALIVHNGAIDPKYAKNYTVYHINPHHFGAVPLNMDVGDAGGDLFFDLHNSIIEPLQCPNGAASGHGCNNPEVVDPDLVVNKLTIEMDSRFSLYAKCNIGVNGTDGHGNTCKDGTYCCYCSRGGHTSAYSCYQNKCYESRHGHMNKTECNSTCGHTNPFEVQYPPSGSVPCNATVGQENVFDYFGKQDGCSAGSPDYDCFRSNAGKKFSTDEPGYWWSPQDIGYCPLHASNPSNCTWRVVSVDKIVSKDCHNDKFFSKVEKETPTCFSACAPAGGARNTSSPCWVRCFYQAVLGPDSGKAGGTVAGIPLDTLVGYWTSAFQDADKGGCAPMNATKKGWFQ